MVNKCSAVGCKSGYASNGDDSHVTFHTFPQDAELREKWIRAIPRKDFVPSTYSRLCSLHFQPCDFVDVRTDSNKSRLQNKSSTPLRRRLKPDAVPSIFPNTPAYFTKTPGVQRSTTKATSSSRHAEECRRLEELEESFTADDSLSELSLAEIADKLKAQSTVPQGFIVTATDESVLMYLFRMTNDIPQVVKSVTLKSDMTLVCSLNDKAVPASEYRDLVKGPVKYVSQLINLMARLKSWLTDSSSRSLSLDIHSAINVLQTAIDNLADTDCDEYRKISFVIEQLRLTVKRQYGRHYSPQRDALQFYADNEGKLSWASTADFLTLILKLWNVLNVKTRTKGWIPFGLHWTGSLSFCGNLRHFCFSGNSLGSRDLARRRR